MASGFEAALPHGGGAVAVWLVGPSAVGKSTVAQDVAVELGLGTLAGSTLVDAVVVDGDAFRDAHRGYSAVAHDGFSRDCVWRQAYPELRNHLRREKAAMVEAAIERRQNLLIPHTCQAREDCWGMANRLRSLGYVNHVVLVLAHKRTAQRRGELRAAATGKRYAPKEWTRSVQNGLGMVTRADGHASLVWTTPRMRWLVKRGRPVDVLRAVRRLRPELLSVEDRKAAEAAEKAHTGARREV